MAQTPKEKDPPIVDVKVRNPITYIKKWWKKVIENEGIFFSFRVRPLTAIAVALVVTSLTLGLGKFVLPFTIPFFQYNPEPATPLVPTPEVWKETAYTGTLRYSEATGKYYLVTTASEAITLQVPENIKLSPYVGRRIFATGKYYKATRTLVVASANDTELLPSASNPIPTTSPTPSPSPTPTFEPASGTDTITPSL
ncbi:hypothetical protein A2V56_00370 [Candidatus Woesebacteria bacterium RBG_19FT_COMBO_42_9]|uniref:Uncharacterized protein n=1 Tax=Candidatus Woesebacteria bacterium RBG_16_42_24 TaxID=1802485 RepID=A0A1F7XJG4_9BACT|nr:MAG: hypothetical protein A2V97_00245 [Candidatus Woesebacteria bacterium RBG_16_42_24]OGM17457.1 MAG: hypothetical protein A2V56_00370 [Candidatus Woesebacteria bacterium RBG_19FT_COMBO_42_9]OGM67144.1 MAG: hypothetical protein A2985_02765 [Candidatus Woesebacteria bacterium RIFCSPLOWO2_01_FULL_43_11]